MKSNRIIAGVAALLMGTATPAFFIDTNTVACEKVYDVRLSAETVEIDINDIPENREVKVGINIDNNPGFLVLAFWIRKDDRLEYKEYCPYDYNMNDLAINNGFSEGNRIIDLAINSTKENQELYYENGLILEMKFTLPSDVKPGDFFEVAPLLDYSGDSILDSPFFRIENSYSSYFGRENFADAVSGGIRITGSLPEPSPSPLPSPSPKPSPSPSPKEQSSNNNGNNNSNGNNGNNGSSNNENGNSSSENKSTESQTTTAVTSAVSETISVSESEILPVSTVSESVTSVTTETEAPATSLEETTVTTVATSAAIVVDKEERSKTYLAAVAAAAVILVAAAVLIAKKNSTKK